MIEAGALFLASADDAVYGINQDVQLFIGDGLGLPHFLYLCHQLLLIFTLNFAKFLDRVQATSSPEEAMTHCVETLRSHAGKSRCVEDLPFCCQSRNVLSKEEIRNQGCDNTSTDYRLLGRRSCKFLRRRVSRSIAHLCRLMDAEDLTSVAERVRIRGE
jgi:hypothetical protein